jgi:preprotein translocase subunit SecE
LVERRSPKPNVAGSSPAWPDDIRVSEAEVGGMKRIIQFFKDSFAELKKVQWPSRSEVSSSTKVVLVSVLIFAVVYGIVDFLLLQGIELIF